jgi:uncharacterized membrane protein YdjX (TVP38/TMEM64 family)
VARLKQWIEGFGALAPVVFIAGYVIAVVFFVPGLPITVLGGVAFGPVWGTLYVWIAATTGAALSFLVARYAVRSTVERWVRASPRLSRLDELAAEHGWRIVMLTRLVPLFPFNLQNYAYGLTRIGFWPYAITSSICMLPGTAAFTFAGGALSEGRGDVRRTLGYLAVAGVLLVLVSLIPRWLQRRSRVAGDLLRAGVMAVLLDAFVLAASASAATAGEEAYARLLKAHVRPGTVNGITLHLVDYRAVRADPAYPQALAALAETRPDALPSDAARFARWANAYNLLAIKAVLDQYPTTSIRDGGSLLSPIWKKKIGAVGGTAYALVPRSPPRAVRGEPARVSARRAGGRVPCEPDQGAPARTGRQDGPRLLHLQVVRGGLRGRGRRGRLHPLAGRAGPGGEAGRAPGRWAQLSRL